MKTLLDPHPQEEGAVWAGHTLAVCAEMRGFPSGAWLLPGQFVSGVC